MATYEVTIVFQAQAESKVVDDFIGKIKGIVVSNEGEIKKCDIWGKKKLAYEIKNCKEGNFVYLEFASSPSVIKQVDKICKLADEIIRYMIIKQTKVNVKKPVLVGEISTQVSESEDRVVEEGSGDALIEDNEGE